jgi:hypothetical protein
MPSDALGASGTAAEPAAYAHLKPSPAMLEFERLVRQEAITEAQQANSAAASADIGAAAALNIPQGKWQQLQQKYNWMDGQMVFRSLFRLCVNSSPQLNDWSPVNPACRGCCLLLAANDSAYKAVRHAIEHKHGSALTSGLQVCT